MVQFQRQSVSVVFSNNFNEKKIFSQTGQFLIFVFVFARIFYLQNVNIIKKFFEKLKNLTKFKTNKFTN